MQNIFYAKQKTTGRKQDVYRVSGSEHMFLERVYSKRHVQEHDFAILKMRKYYVYKGCCSALTANYGMFCLLEMLKLTDASFEFVDYNTFIGALNLNDDHTNTEILDLVDDYPILSAIENELVREICDSAISKKYCRCELNMITYRSDVYVFSKSKLSLYQEISTTKLLRRVMTYSKLYFECEGRESVVFRTYFTDYFAWMSEVKTMNLDISSFFISNHFFTRIDPFQDQNLKIERVLVWTDDKFKVWDSQWLHDEDTYYITIHINMDCPENHSQLYPFNSIVLCNNKQEGMTIAKFVEIEFRAKAKIIDSNDNLDFLFQNNYFYVQKASKPTSVFMVYDMNGMKVKEISKDAVNNLSTYVYTFHDIYYIWKGDVSTREELEFAVKFVKSRSVNFHIVSINQFKELIHRDYLTEYPVPHKIANNPVKIFGLSDTKIISLHTVNISDKKYIAFLVDFYSFVIIIKNSKITRSKIQRYAKIYSELERYSSTIKNVYKSIYFVENGASSSFMSFFIEPKKKCCLKFFSKPDKLVDIEKENKQD